MIYCRRHRLVERQDGVVGIMDMLKRVLAVLGATFGSLALFNFVFAWSLTLKDFGSSVEAQLIAQRILTLLLLAALPVVIVLIKPVYQARGRTVADGQCILTTPSNAFSGFAEAFVCLKSRFSAAKVSYDLSSFDKMVVNSITCTKRANSRSRLEHVECVN